PRQRAAGLLREHYRAAGRTTDVLRMLEVELEVVPDKKERARRVREIAGLRLELGDELGALESVATLVGLEPRIAKHRAELARLAHQTGHEARQAEVLAAVAESVTEPKLRRDLLLEAMKLYRDVLGDRGRAADVALVALRLAKDDRETELPIA